MIKTGLLAGGRLWEMVCEWEPGRGSTEQRLELIRRCAAYKAHIVSTDPREQGLRAVLNLGHSIGHAIEAAAGFSIPHGEAVGVGLLQALWLSTRAAGLDPAIERETRRLLKRHGLPAAHRGVVTAAAVREALSRDKKARSGRVRFVLLEAVGRPVWGVDIDDVLIDEAIARAV